MAQTLFTIDTQLISPDCECLFFNDAHLEMEDPIRNFEDDSTLPHFSFNLGQVRDLRDFLNKAEVAALLDQ